MWVGLSKKHKDNARETWKTADPAGFAAQERRRTDFEAMKARGKVATASPAVHLWSRGADAINYGDDVGHEPCPTPAAPAVQAGIIVQGESPAELLKEGKRALSKGVSGTCLSKFAVQMHLSLAPRFHPTQSP